MAANTRFAVAIHTMSVLACAGDEPVTSEVVAKSVNTNPVVIRRLLLSLIKGGLVESQKGKSGGARLARKPEKITLWDIYRCIEPDELFGLPEKAHNKTCMVSCEMKGLLTDVFGKAERSVEKILEGRTLSDFTRPLR